MFTNLNNLNMISNFLLYVIPLFSFVAYRTKIYHMFLFLFYEAVYWGVGLFCSIWDNIFARHDQYTETPKRSGEVAIVTGGARGIGVEVVKKLLQCDMTVVIACRNVDAGKTTVAALRSSGITTGVTDVLPLDTASQTAVKKFAQLFLAKYNKLHLLINNAGVMAIPFHRTEDGFESQMATNFFGHFQLTHLLLPTLVKTGREAGRQSRIVNLASVGHAVASIKFDDINCERRCYIATAAYGESKLAQIMFTKCLARRLKSKSVPVAVFAVHPGVVDTQLFDTPQKGVPTVIYAALSSDLEDQNGEYLSNCQRGYLSSAALNQQYQEKLMELTERLLQISNFGNLD